MMMMMIFFLELLQVRRLGQQPLVTIAAGFFYRLDALPFIQLTASKH